jgi:sec-independent protein translocase protein TatC
MIMIGPQEALMAYVNVSILIAFALTLPVITYHMWAFIAPGLLKKEKMMLAYLVIPSVALFVIGVSFGYFILLPIILRFLIASAVPLAIPMLSLESTFSFIVTILLALGLVFQLPLITAALTKLGVIRPKTLTGNRRHAIVLLFLAAGIITPDPTVVPQIILAVPLILLYEIGILTSKLAGGGRC